MLSPKPVSLGLSKMLPRPYRILQKRIIFRGSDTHLTEFEDSKQHSPKQSQKKENVKRTFESQ